MSLHSSPTEMVTAASNVPLALTALTAVISVWRWRQAHSLRARLWIGMFGSLAIASGLGVFVHGLALDPTAKKLLWHPINAALALTVACFVAGAVLDGWGALTVNGRPGASWMLAGVAITILAAALQATPVAFQFGVTFDHNAVFHIVQVPGLFCLLAGVRIGLGNELAQDSSLTAELPYPARSL